MIPDWLASICIVVAFFAGVFVGFCLLSWDTMRQEARREARRAAMDHRHAVEEEEFHHLLRTVKAHEQMRCAFGVERERGRA